MNKLKELADISESLAEIDFGNTPNARLINELISTLVYEEKFSKVFATKIAFRMKIDVIAFDACDPDWQRIISNYGIMISKIYDMSGEDEDTMLVLAQSLTLKYNY